LYKRQKEQIEELRGFKRASEETAGCFTKRKTTIHPQYVKAFREEEGKKGQVMFDVILHFWNNKTGLLL
jgi:hypothetical protein